MSAPEALKFTPHLLGLTLTVGRSDSAIITDETVCEVQIERDGRKPVRMAKPLFYERIGRRRGRLHLFSR